MSSSIKTLSLEDYQALERMTHHDQPFAAKIAKATLAIVEARRDAEVRAAAAEARLEHEQHKLLAIHKVLLDLSDGKIGGEMATQRIGALVSGLWQSD